MALSLNPLAARQVDTNATNATINGGKYLQTPQQPSEIGALNLSAQGSGISGVLDGLVNGVAQRASGSGSGSGSGAGAAAAKANAERAATLQYIADQESLANQGLGRLTNQRDIGLSNITNSANQAYNQLASSKATAERDYGLSQTQAREDNMAARNAVDSTVRNNSRGLQSLLGARGAGSSSAAKYLAPFLVAQQGAEKAGANQQTFSRNQQSLDKNWQDALRSYEEQRSGVDLETQQRQNELNAGVEQNRVGLLQQLANLQLERARANGQDYGSVRGAVQGYNANIQNALNSIDQLSRLYANPVSKVTDVTYAAPDLAQYDTSRITGVGGDLAPGIADTVGQYYNLIGRDEERQGALI